MTSVAGKPGRVNLTVSGNKTLHKDGYPIAATEFDDKRDGDGHTKNSWSYYGIDGRPVETSSTGGTRHFPSSMSMAVPLNTPVSTASAAPQSLATDFIRQS